MLELTFVLRGVEISFRFCDAKEPASASETKQLHRTNGFIFMTSSSRESKVASMFSRLERRRQTILSAR